MQRIARSREAEVADPAVDTCSALLRQSWRSVKGQQRPGQPGQITVQIGPPQVRAKALAGYITAKSGRRLVFALAVNDVGTFTGIEPVLQILEDQGTIAAILWRES